MFNNSICKFSIFFNTKCKKLKKKCKKLKKKLQVPDYQDSYFSLFFQYVHRFVYFTVIAQPTDNLNDFLFGTMQHLHQSINA